MKTIQLFLLAVICVLCRADDVIRSESHVDCSSFSTNARNVAALNETLPVIVKSITSWQGLLLILAYGVLSAILALIHRFIRSYVYYDAHLLDTLHDAGGDVTTAMVMCSVVGKWTWTAALTWSVYNMTQYGVVGHFWFCAGFMIQPFLFSIVACEIRIKAPGAKTFLQVIYARFGAPAHVVIMLFTLFISFAFASIVMYEGTNMLHTLIQDIRREIIIIVLAVSVAAFTLIGGVGGSLYVASFSVIFILAIILVYFVEVFYGSFLNLPTLGSWENIYNVIDCYKVDDATGTDLNSPISFISKGGVVEGVLIILSGMSGMFVSQNFWQTAVTAKPTQTVWGFLLAGFVWFAIPLGASYGLGTAYQVWTVQNGAHPVPMSQVLKGALPVFISQQLLSQTGDLLMLVLTSAVVITSAAGEVLAASSIVVYDIYRTYTAPFKPIAKMEQQEFDFQTMPVKSKKSLQNEEYLQYDKRCVTLRYVTVAVFSLLLIPLAVALFAINVDAMYLYKILGVFCGCCVLPICLAITWHRLTGLAVCLGIFAGFLAGIVGWLVYASTFDGGLEQFYVNTRRSEPMLAGMMLSFFIGGIVALCSSLCCGGCDSDKVEEDEWEKTRAIDSQLLPWAVKYAPQFKHMKLKGIPHFYAVRRTFKSAEMSAYIVGSFLTACVIVVWPACMLLEADWSKRVYAGWTIMVTILLAAACAIAALYPLISEIYVVCRQKYYNRKWSDRQQPQRLKEEDMSHMERSHNADANSVKTADSDFVSTIDSCMNDGAHQDRWKTFIHLE